MVMVDMLLDCDPVVTVTQLTVRPDNILVDDGCLSACGLIENIAQTCAVRIGFLNRHSGQPPRLGVIGALRDMTFSALPPVGETVTTTIRVQEEIFGMTLAEARTVDSTGTTLAEGTIKIALL